MPVIGTTTTTVTVSGTVPPTGLVYVTIHLDYGLKRQDFSKLASGSSASCPSTNTGPCAQLASNPSVIIGSPQSYSFSFTDGASASTSPTSVNVFKKDPGFAGVVTDSTENPIANAKVKIYDPSGNLLAIVYTDLNGVYLYQYKYTGSKVYFTITATVTNVSQTATVLLQANKLVLQNFSF